MKEFICKTITAANNIGLSVRGLTSDMGSNNKAMWVALNVCVNRTERRISFEVENGVKINVFADICYLAKNWRNAIGKYGNIITLPQTTIANEDLLSNVMKGDYIKNYLIAKVREVAG